MKKHSEYIKGREETKITQYQLSLHNDPILKNEQCAQNHLLPRGQESFVQEFSEGMLYLIYSILIIPQS